MGAAGYIGSYAALWLLKDPFRVTIVPFKRKYCRDQGPSELAFDFVRFFYVLQNSFVGKSIRGRWTIHIDGLAITNLQVSSNNATSHDRKIMSSAQKAFTGFMIEQDDNLLLIQLLSSNNSEKVSYLFEAVHSYRFSC